MGSCVRDKAISTGCGRTQHFLKGIPDLLTGTCTSSYVPVSRVECSRCYISHFMLDYELLPGCAVAYRLASRERQSNPLHAQLRAHDCLTKLIIGSGQAGFEGKMLTNPDHPEEDDKCLVLHQEHL